MRCRAQNCTEKNQPGSDWCKRHGADKTITACAVPRCFYRVAWEVRKGLYKTNDNSKKLCEAHQLEPEMTKLYDPTYVHPAHRVPDVRKSRPRGLRHGPKRR